MSEEIYDLEEGIEYEDSTVLESDSQGKLIVVDAEDIIFSEAAGDLNTAKDLESVLRDIQRASEDPDYVPSSDLVARFGVKEGAEEVVEEILKRYVKVCREKGEKFGPGTQYNFHKLTGEGIEVTMGNYGLFFATLDEASKDPEFKSYLIEKGQEIYGSKQAFFFNPPATNAVVETNDGYILIVNRGDTAEYGNMYHQVAAGHHNPSGDSEIELEALIAQQIRQEVNVEDILEFQMNGVAFSKGRDYPGTEKAEILTYAKIDCSSDEVFAKLSEAEHKWETRQLAAVPKANVSQLLDGNTNVTAVEGVKIFGDQNITPGHDERAATNWVPVGLAGLRTYAS